MTNAELPDRPDPSFSTDAYRPVDLHLDRKDGLRVKWADGAKSHFPLAYLRKRCPCATCRHDDGPPPPKAGGDLALSVLPAGIDRATQFADARPVGNYAIQITWGDGHSTGIYDFEYLRSISPPDGDAS